MRHILAQRSIRAIFAHILLNILPNSTVLALGSMSVVLVLLVQSGMFVPVVNAQHLLNDVVGRMTNTQSGIIRLRSWNGELRNTNATATAVVNAGVIELLGARNQFVGRFPAAAQEGDATALGNSHPWRIGGLVRYTPASDTVRTQTVQGRFYTNLELAGSSRKRVLDGVRVGGDSLPTLNPSWPMLGSGVYRTSGGERLYEGTFFYDNAQQQSLLGGERYNAIELQRGRNSRMGARDNVKIIPPDAVVTTQRVFRQSSGISTTPNALNAPSEANLAGLDVLGTLLIGGRGEFPAMSATLFAAPTLLANGTGEVHIGRPLALPANTNANSSTATASQLIVGADSTLFGVAQVRVNSGWLLTSSPLGVLVVQPTCTLRLMDNAVFGTATFGTLSLPASGHQMLVQGVVVNEFAPRTNTLLHPASTVTYSSSASQRVMQTIPSHAYGNVTLQTPSEGRTNASLTGRINPIAHTIAPTAPPRNAADNGMVAVRGNVRCAGAGLDATSVANGALVMLTPQASITFAGLEEVQGTLRRVASPTVRAYTMNNAQTRLMDVESAAAFPQTLTLDVRPNAEPPLYEPRTDVRRMVTWSWTLGDSSATSTSNAAQTVWKATLRLGYRKNELAETFDADNEARLSFYENRPQPASPFFPRILPRLLGARGIERIAAQESAFGTVQLPLLEAQPPQSPQADQMLPRGSTVVFSGRQVLMRGTGLLVRSLRDGRWSNPATWDIGREPSSGDTVEIAHNVHIGFRRLGIDGMSADGQVWEQSSAQQRVEPMADNIRIVGTRQTDSSQGALLLGCMGEVEAGLAEGFADERAPRSGVWRLAKGLVRVGGGADAGGVGASVEDVTRAALVDAQTGARTNTRRNYRGLHVFQNPFQNSFQAPIGQAPTVQIRQLINEGLLCNGGSLELGE
jgi:hypothetical protein